METQRFLVKPKQSVFIMCGLFFGVCTWVLLLAASEHRGLSLFRLIHLTPEQAPYFYWALAFFSICLSLLGFASAVFNYRSGDKYIEVSETDIVIPQMMLTSRKRLRYDDIQLLKETVVSGTRSLEIRTTQAKGHLTNRYFQSNEPYEQIKSILFQRSRYGRENLQ